VKLIRVMAETLAGIPSIIYALFGLLAFVVTLGIGISLLSGALTLAIMTLPLILRQTEESLLAVPMSYREGSYGLGCRWPPPAFWLRCCCPSAASQARRLP